MSETTEVEIPVAVAPEISADSWLQEPEYAAFRRAYGYAATQTAAIPALASLSPEDVYHLFMTLQRGQA